MEHIPKPLSNPPVTPLDCCQLMLASAVYHSLSGLLSMLWKQTVCAQHAVPHLSKPMLLQLFSFAPFLHLLAPTICCTLVGWDAGACWSGLSWHLQESFCLHNSRKEKCKHGCKSLGELQLSASALSNGTSGTKPLIKGLKWKFNKLPRSLVILWNQWPESCWLQWIWALT